jgi:hypothetical protein
MESNLEPLLDDEALQEKADQLQLMFHRVTEDFS